MKKVVFLGINHAGTVAIDTLLENSNEYEVTAYEMNDNCSFLGCGIALWISGVVKDPKGLFYSSPETLRSKGAKIFLKHRVTNIDYKNKKIKVTDLQTGKEKEDSYDKLVISVGSTPFRPNFKNSNFGDWKNITTVKTYQDAQWIIDQLKDSKVKKVSVIGGGYIGVELAEAAREYGKEVTLIDATDRILIRYYDQEFTDEMTKVMSGEEVKIELEQMVLDLKGKDQIVSSLITDKKEIPTDLAIFAIGATPNTKWLVNDELKMLPNGAIVVDEYQQTSIKDVYAIGDCSTIYNNVKKDVDYIALATNAVRTGEVAGYHLAGKTHYKMSGVQGSNAISIYGLNMASTGYTKSTAIKMGFDAEEVYMETEQKPKFMNEPHKVMIKVVYDKKNRLIIGAQLASTYDISMAIHIYSLAITKQTTIDEMQFMDFFFLPRFNNPFNYLNDVALKAKK